MTIGIVIVNYNLSAHSIDAALSALGDAPDAKVVIVDNSSNSQEKSYLVDVLSGKLKHNCEPPPGASPRPIFASLKDVKLAKQDDAPQADENVFIICSEKNSGFSAGCNIGLRFLRNNFALKYFLLLNPDALVAPKTIAAFKSRLNQPNSGLCGASVMRFDDCNIAQAFGGASLNKMTLLGQNIGANLRIENAPSNTAVEASLSYPLGAAIALRKEYLDQIGGLDERFFLYYEEADWAMRGMETFRTVWAKDAIIFHRHGAAAGSRLLSGRRSPFSDYHMVRSRLLFALKWRRVAIPSVLCLSLMQVVRRVFRGQIRNAVAVFFGSVGVKIQFR